MIHNHHAMGKINNGLLHNILKVLILNWIIYGKFSLKSLERAFEKSKSGYSV
jgi:hypothetical protein